MHTTPSGFGRPGPTGELATADSEIAGGSESPAFVALNSVALLWVQVGDEWFLQDNEEAA